MHTITATLVAYYHICHRKVWLHAHQIQMESGSEAVAEGKLIGETTYADRPGRYTEVALEGIKIDFYDPKTGVIHEVKKTQKMEAAHIAQLKYYLYKLEQNGILANYGLLEYPKTRETKRVELSDEDRTQIPLWEADIGRIIGAESCPAVIHKPVCKQCAFYEFCYVQEA